MRIRTKLMTLSLVFSAGSMVFAVLGVIAWNRVRSINNAIEKGKAAAYAEAFGGPRYMTLDQVALYSDDVRDVCRELSRQGASPRVGMALYYFDASTNCVAVWEAGTMAALHTEE